MRIEPVQAKVVSPSLKTDPYAIIYARYIPRHFTVPWVVGEHASVLD